MRPSEYKSLVEVWSNAGLTWFRKDGVDGEEAIKQQAGSEAVTVFFAWVDEKPVGAVIASYDGRYGWISRLAVVEEHKRHGIASKLLEHAEQYLLARGARTVLALVFEKNEPSKALFSRRGYHIERDLYLAIKRINADSPTERHK